MNMPSRLERYSPDLDKPHSDEKQTADAISKTMTEIADKTFADGGHAIRSVHAKSHGILCGKFEVLAGLSAPLAQGVFARTAAYPVVMRFSTVPGDLLDDSISTPRGLAIKIIGIEGQRLEGSKRDSNQDFVMVNGPTFNAPSAKAFHQSLKLLAPTTDRMPDMKKGVSAVMRGVEKTLEVFGGQSALAKALGGEPPTHILGETFYSQLPLRYGDYIAKVQVAPVSPDLTSLTGRPVDIGRPDILRELVIDHFQHNTSTWEFRVQLCANLETMPIDNPTRRWDEAESPFIPVARLIVEPQSGWNSSRSEAVDDGMSFSPWHGIEDHRPLGEMMRIRKDVYNRSQRFRSERNRRPVREPQTADDLKF
ncbi:MAG: catalase family protein [Proteobacteria bacterium]|nr:catalase family protein [Pseudomonadota bacterium]